MDPWAIVWCCLCDPTFSRLNRTPTCDRHRQTDTGSWLVPRMQRHFRWLWMTFRGKSPMTKLPSLSEWDSHTAVQQLTWYSARSLRQLSLWWLVNHQSSFSMYLPKMYDLENAQKIPEKVQVVQLGCTGSLYTCIPVSHRHPWSALACAATDKFFYQLGLCTARRLRACCFSNNSVSTKCTLLVCFCKTLHEALYVQSVIVIYCTSICLSRVASSVSKRVNERQCVKKHFEFSYTKFVNKIPIGSISVLLQYSRNPRRNNIHCESKNQTPNSCP